ncbi:MAG: J domain-containing protein [Lachnospiraceae bacterium]|nr:J domain-containing protein [Lachnospiraceae bacterium]
MADPYKVLGLTRDASEEEIKKAYRTLSRKYHTDSNVDNPNREKAEEMFKLVQQAYEQIMDERAHGSSYSGSYSGSSSSYGGSYQGNPFGGFGSFGGFGPFGGFGTYRNTQSSSGDDEETVRMRAAANYLQSRHYREALNVLQSITNRTAQWYYYSALANAGLGNNVTAREHAKTAVDMEPYNTYYRDFLTRLNSGGDWYNTQRAPYGGMYTNIDTGFCARLCLMNLVCNMCCGGRLFFC